MIPDKQTVQQVAITHKGAVEALKMVQSSRRKAQRRVEAATEGHQIIQSIAADMQNKMHQRVAAIVSECLTAVFDAPYEFVIRFERKRGRTEANMLFLRDGNEIDPMTASGGGVIDVTAFALRLACIILSQPRCRKLIILDEPFKFVSSEYRPSICVLLKQLAKKTGFQFLVITHVPDLESGNIVSL